MIKYRFDLYRGGVKKAELTEVENIAFGYKRNAFTKAVFSHNGNNLESLLYTNLAKGSELRVYRQGEMDSSLRLIWAGELQKITKSVDNQDVKTYDIEVEPWGNVFFKNRFVTTTFTTTEESVIASGIVNYIQTETFSGAFTASQVDWGITIGTLETTGNVRTRVYVDDEALKMLQQLADAADIGGNPQRVRAFRLSPTLTRSDLSVFSYEAEYGQVRNVTLTNPVIDSIKEISDLGDYANRVIATGEGTNATANSINTTDLDFYKMRQKFESANNTSDATTLQEIADGALDTSEAALGDKVYQVELVENNIFTGMFECGDTIGIQYLDPEDGFINIDATFQVYEININFDKEGREKTSIKVSQTKPQSLQLDNVDKFITRVNDNNERLTVLEK